MNDSETILVPVDDTDRSKAAAQRAISIARGTGARICLLHALSFPASAIEAGIRDELVDEFRESETHRFSEFCDALDGHGVEISKSFVERDPVEAIDELARECRTPLIVMGTHSRRGLDRLILGSIAEQTLQNARGGALLVVREDVEAASQPIRSILFATDFSESAQQAEAMLVSWARLYGAEVEVFHSIRETAVLFAPYAVVGSSDFEGEMYDAAKQRMRRVLERLKAQGIFAKSKIVYGRPEEEILRRAETTNADLIAIGTRGYSGLNRFLLGSVAQRVLRHAPCSVLVVNGSHDVRHKSLP
jgi:nucleotide-binding universal stress UspA family protein